MPDKEKDAYHAIAAEEEGVRQEAMLQPYQAKSHSANNVVPLGKASFDAAANLGRNALKKLSLHRLLVTYQEYKNGEGWSDFDAGLARPEGAMSLDDIDLDTSQDDIQKTWSRFVGSACLHHKNQEIAMDTRLASLHHKVCGQGFGLCKREAAFYLEAQRFARSLHHFIGKGFQAEQECSQTVVAEVS